MLAGVLWHSWLGVLKGWIDLSLTYMKSLIEWKIFVILHLGCGGCHPVKNCVQLFWFFIPSFFHKHPWSPYYVPDILLDAGKTTENKPFWGGDIQVEIQVIWRCQTCKDLRAEHPRGREQRAPAPKERKSLVVWGSKRRTVWLEQSKHGETWYVMMRSRGVDRS